MRLGVQVELADKLAEVLAATREALIDMAGKQHEIDAETREFGMVVAVAPYKQEAQQFRHLGGSSVTCLKDEVIRHPFMVGDELHVKIDQYGAGDLPEAVEQAKKLVVVGFTKYFMLVQLDNQLVWDTSVTTAAECCNIASRVGRPLGSCVVVLDGKMQNMPIQPGCPVKVGQVVQIGTQSGQMRPSQPGDSIAVGQPATVVQVLDNILEVSAEGATQFVHRGAPADIQLGDRVLLDRSGTVVLKHLGPPATPVSTSRPETVHWSDIGGLEEAKQTLIEAVELPHRYPEMYRAYGKRPTKGVLLYGPPGCGKTMLGKAVAGSLQDTHGPSDSAFIYVKGPELLDPYVGVTEQKIRLLFQQARQHQAKHGYPAVLFLDEADALLGKRGGNGLQHHMSGTVVPQFLTEMDGLDTSAALVILATNRQDILDPAVVREGRIDQKVCVTRPNQDATQQILLNLLVNVPIHDGVSADELADMGGRELFSKERQFYRIHTQREVIPFTLSNLLNGAMVANVVDRASQLALRRDLTAGAMSWTGINLPDIRQAVADVDRANREIQHEDALEMFAEQVGEPITSVERVQWGV